MNRGCKITKRLLEKAEMGGGTVVGTVRSTTKHRIHFTNQDHPPHSVQLSWKQITSTEHFLELDGESFRAYASESKVIPHG